MQDDATAAHDRIEDIDATSLTCDQRRRFAEHNMQQQGIDYFQ
jgi:hypothetical protein